MLKFKQNAIIPSENLQLAGIENSRHFFVQKEEMPCFWQNSLANGAFIDLYFKLRITFGITQNVVVLRRRIFAFKTPAKDGKTPETL